MVLNIILELLSTLALATKELKNGQSSESIFFRHSTFAQGNTVNFVKNGEKDVEAVLQRLTQGEGRTAQTETLEAVQGPIQNVRVRAMDSEQAHSTCYVIY